MRTLRQAFATNFRVWLICFVVLALGTGWIEVFPGFKPWELWGLYLDDLGSLFCGDGWIPFTVYNEHGYFPQGIYLISIYLVVGWCMQRLVVLWRNQWNATRVQRLPPKPIVADKYGAFVINGAFLIEFFFFCRNYYLSGWKDLQIDDSSYVIEFIANGVVLVLLIRVFRRSNWFRKFVAFILAVYPILVMVGSFLWSREMLLNK